MAAGLGSLGSDTEDCRSVEVISLSAAISACEKGQQWQRVLGLLALMQVAGLVPNVISYNAGVSACEKSDQW